MDAHVGKPFEWEELFQSIQRLCNFPASELNPSAMPSEEAPAFILDETVLANLAALLGREKISALLALFRKDTERRLSLLEGAGVTGQDLFAHTHAVVSSAGQLGFKELSELCVEIERLSRAGGGLDRIAALRAVANRAIEASAASYNKAA
jgi:HPt (histidine-containing phosphotransfer) domain-containing protein